MWYVTPPVVPELSVWDAPPISPAAADLNDVVVCVKLLRCPSAEHHVVPHRRRQRASKSRGRIWYSTHTARPAKSSAPAPVRSKAVV